MNEARTAEMDPRLLLALAPQGDGDVADTKCLGDTRALGLFKPRAHLWLAAARFASDKYTAGAGAYQVEAALKRRLCATANVGSSSAGGGALDKVGGKPTQRAYPSVNPVPSSNWLMLCCHSGCSARVETRSDPERDECCERDGG